jgi:hypothetical protein
MIILHGPRQSMRYDAVIVSINGGSRLLRHGVEFHAGGITPFKATNIDIVVNPQMIG